MGSRQHVQECRFAGSSSNLDVQSLVSSLEFEVLSEAVDELLEAEASELALVDEESVSTTRNLHFECSHMFFWLRSNVGQLGSSLHEYFPNGTSEIFRSQSDAQVELDFCRFD
jgi:hypothetical protein